MQLFYTVRPGETLYQIAGRWRLPVESLIAANNLASPYTIFPGQQLSVPPGVDKVRINPGDTVYSIAQFFGIPMSVIIETNRLLPPYTIQAGQLIKVPPGVSYYVVQPGDTLFHIARRYNVTTKGSVHWQLIQSVNRLPSDVIYPGMRLIVPYAPTGDQGMIAYSSNRGGDYDLWLYDPADGSRRQLTSGAGSPTATPFWSPDSSRIAFIGNRGILYVIHIAENLLASIDQFPNGLGVFLSWSPDSRIVAYAKPNEIILYNIITHQVQRLNQPGATDVQWFSNGKTLLFQAPDSSGISQLFTIEADGTNKRQITQNTGSTYNNVRLSPDNTYVLYTTPGVSISIIYTIELSTGRVFEVRGGPLAKNYFPVWSPDSSAIAYSATAFEDVGYFSLVNTTGRQGENDRTRAISDCFATPVTWSPDSRKIAYLSGCNGEGIATEMWVVDSLRPVPVRLIAGESITSLQWSPHS
ncbi:hypothetical protein GCM10007216_28380 [Thalassobacillus devorans]|uniref:LysM domain-containing protein n=1 Tax=Thalassobacillus devorans TaxID=279813 RepID=A0ABQ1PF41_9BACI|nr:LysM peptidoglycan-binding domain-containing protein [Thalassobacillus devorans]NIK29343.1 TolB protein [Thalassobacillus devorans]GGC95930.1 hypothetical protein GCM10007216_28380 [Thalassobacillus devorans]